MKNSVGNKPWRKMYLGPCTGLPISSAARWRLATSPHSACHVEFATQKGQVSWRTPSSTVKGTRGRIQDQTVTALGLAPVPLTPPWVQQQLASPCEVSLSNTFQNILISKLSQRNEHTISIGKLYILKIFYHHSHLVFLRN